MIALFNRLLVSLACALALSSLASIAIHPAVIQTLYMVIGVAYSLLISSIVGFDMREVLNRKYRDWYTAMLKRAKFLNTADFAIASLVFAASASFPDASASYGPFALSLANFAGCSLAMSLFYLSFSFQDIFKHKLKLSEQVYEDQLEKMQDLELENNQETGDSKET